MTRTAKTFSLAALLAACLLGLGHSASAAPLTLADVSDPQGGFLTLHCLLSSDPTLHGC